MQSLFSILQNNKPSSSPLLQAVSASLAVEIANEILINKFGQTIAEYASATYVKNGVLTIACLSSTAAQEIKLQEANLVTLINKKMGFTAVKKIKYLS